MPLKNQASFNLGLTAQPEVNQKKYGDLYGEFLRLHNAIELVQQALDIYTGALSEDPQYWSSSKATSVARVQNISKVYAQATENISLAQVVHFQNSAGALTARKADATDATKLCRAFCTTSGGVLSGAYGEFVLLGVNPYYSGLTPGTPYYLTTAAGQISATAPAVVGNVVQPVGYALSPTDLWFIPSLNFTQL